MLSASPKKEPFQQGLNNPDDGTYIFKKGPGIRLSLLFSFPLWLSSEQPLPNVVSLQL